MCTRYNTIDCTIFLAAGRERDRIELTETFGQIGLLVDEDLSADDRAEGCERLE